MQLKFEKWHGCKNDFLVLRIPSHDQILFDSLQRRAKDLCARDGGGVGADGLIIMHEPPRNTPKEGPVKLSVINSDGSLAKTCGNGIRCAALSVLVAHLESGPHESMEGVQFDLAGDLVDCRFLSRGKSQSAQALPLVAAAMGVPKVNEANTWFPEAKKTVKAVFEKLNLASLKYELGVCEIGNQHLVFFMPDADRALMRKIGPALQSEKPWSTGINVHLVCAREVSDKERAAAANQLGGDGYQEGYTAFVWERGAGETQACGTGACAIAACAFVSGDASRDGWLGIDMPGGRLYVKQDEDDDPVTLVGPGELVFRGSLDF